MPLHRSSELDAFSLPDKSAIVFHMDDDSQDRPVRITVQLGALLMLDGGVNPISLFELHRSKFERIASAKFDSLAPSTNAEMDINAHDISKSLDLPTPVAVLDVKLSP